MGDFEIKAGDTLLLREWGPDKGEYTGRQVEVKVIGVLRTKDQPYYSKDEISQYGFQVIQIER